MPHADALSRLHFDDETSNEEKIYFFQFDIFFADQQTIKLNNIKSNLQSNQSFQYVLKRIQSGDGRQCSEAELHFKKEAETLTEREGTIYKGVVPFIVPNSNWWLWKMSTRRIQEVRQQKRSWELLLGGLAYHKTWNNLSLERTVKNRPLLGKTVSKWPEADVWEQIRMAWATMKEQGNVFVVVDAENGWIEAFPTIYRSTLAVNKYLSVVFARSGVPKTLVSDNYPNLWAMTSKQGASLRYITKCNHRSTTQEQMD